MTGQKEVFHLKDINGVCALLEIRLFFPDLLQTPNELVLGFFQLSTSLPLHFKGPLKIKEFRRIAEDAVDRGGFPPFELPEHDQMKTDLNKKSTWDFRWSRQYRSYPEINL